MTHLPKTGGNGVRINCIKRGATLYEGDEAAKSPVYGGAGNDESLQIVIREEGGRF